MAAVAAAPAAPVEQIVDDLMTRDLAALEQAAPSALEQVAAAQLAAREVEQEAEGDPWEQQLMTQAVDMEADTARQNAISSFFGEDPIARVPLPPAIEEAINRFVANI